jgi:hypothetical protein
MGLQISIPETVDLETSVKQVGKQWTPWEVRLSELAAYRKSTGCRNAVPKQRNSSWLIGSINKSSLHARKDITLSPVQELESMGFEWGSAPPRRTV